MNSIAVCIPTYKRTELLSKLITTIRGSIIDSSLISNMNLVIVDNDSARSAESVVKGFIKDKIENIDVEYHCFPVKGLSNVRNELLKRALRLNPDYIIFVDDDEHVSSEWLSELVKAIVVNKGDLVMGPVVSLFNEDVPESISCWFQRQGYPNNSRIDSIATNNLIINVATLRRLDVWFDNRFNTTGAEDSFFGIKMLKGGAKGFWAEKAIVFETIPASRSNLKWLLKRYYNAANTYTYILKLEKEFMRLGRKIGVSIFYIISGLIASLLIPFPIKKRYWGLLKLSEGIGAISGSLNVKYNEYK